MGTTLLLQAFSFLTCAPEQGAVPMFLIVGSGTFFLITNTAGAILAIRRNLPHPPDTQVPRSCGALSFFDCFHRAHPVGREVAPPSDPGPVKWSGGRCAHPLPVERGTGCPIESLATVLRLRIVVASNNCNGGRKTPPLIIISYPQTALSGPRSMRSHINKSQPPFLVKQAELQ